jgi:polyhydroxybutyrate depolymerase
VDIDAPLTVDSSTIIPPLDCSSRTAQPLDATWTVMVGGTARTTLVHVPASYDPMVPTAVVIDLHGLGGDGAMEAGLTSANAKSDMAGFISVHPNGATVPGSWNAGGCCGTAPSQNIDDIGFMKQLVDDLDAKLCVDDARVFAMGMSNGGYMSHRIGCELADRFAAIGPVAGGIATATCAPSRPVPVFAIHGNADPLVSYSFGQSSANAWATGNGCTTTTTTYTNGVASCVTHGGCTAGADVVFCTIDQGGHQWPGGETLPLLGNNTTDIDATEAIWTFFVAHPKP